MRPLLRRLLVSLVSTGIAFATMPAAGAPPGPAGAAAPPALATAR